MLKLISINIEGSKHFKLFIPFIKSENPDVVCMQEVIKDDIEFLERELGMKSVFAPQAYHLILDDVRLVGVAMFSKLPIENIRKDYYVGNEDHLVHVSREDMSSAEFHKMINRAVISADIIKGDDIYKIATTHFTWTPEGKSTDYQINDLKELFRMLDNLGDFVFTGDLNAPRGMKTFSMLAEKYKDNIPQQYDNSLDPNLHRIKGLKHMVDALFTNGRYEAKNVRLQDGVSDHMAIVAEIYKNA